MASAPPIRRAPPLSADPRLPACTMASHCWHCIEALTGMEVHRCCFCNETRNVHRRGAQCVNGIHGRFMP